MEMFAAILFLAALVFAFGASEETRVRVGVIIFAAIGFALYGVGFAFAMVAVLLASVIYARLG
jgi:hypothetical protein